MRRLLLHFTIALLTFSVGNGLSATFKARKLTDEEIMVCLTLPRMCVDQDLIRRLEAVDREHGARCWTYHGPSGEDKEKSGARRLKRCYGEWEEARRVVFEGE